MNIFMNITQWLTSFVEVLEINGLKYNDLKGSLFLQEIRKFDYVNKQNAKMNYEIASYVYSNLIAEADHV